MYDDFRDSGRAFCAIAASISAKVRDVTKYQLLPPYQLRYFERNRQANVFDESASWSQSYWNI